MVGRHRSARFDRLGVALRVHALSVSLGYAGLMRIFERFGGLRRHVVFVMLSEHFTRDKHTGFVEFALRNNALLFGKEVGQNALIFDINRLRRIGDTEVNGYAVLSRTTEFFSTTPPRRNVRPTGASLAAT